MKIAFAGTPEFAAAALRRLLGAGFAVPLVLTQPDRRSGRGMRTEPGPVKQVALAAGIEVLQPESLRSDLAAVARLREVRPDAIVVAAYGLILPQAVLDVPTHGCINIHGSLLPRWRGAAPVQRAIEAGDSQTGVCIMRMEAGLDTGPVLLEARVPIGANDNAASLTTTLAGVGAGLIVDALRRLDTLVPHPQASDGVTYAAKIGKSEAPLDFSAAAAALARKVRAFDPFPGATASVGGQVIKVWQAHTNACAADVAPGTILRADSDGIEVACGNSRLVLTVLQRPGSKRLPAREFLSGFPLVAGSRFDPPAHA